MQCAGSGNRIPHRVTGCDLHCINTSDAWLSIGLQICKPIPRPGGNTAGRLVLLCELRLTFGALACRPHQNREIEVVALEQMGERLC